MRLIHDVSRPVLLLSPHIFIATDCVVMNCPRVVCGHSLDLYHTGKCIRRFAGIYAYCRYLLDRKW